MVIIPVLCRYSMPLRWRLISQRQVRTTLVVETHRLIDRRKRYRLAAKGSAQTILRLQNPVDPLGLRVLIAVILLRHTDSKPSLAPPLNVGPAAVLRSPVRGVDWSLSPAVKRDRSGSPTPTAAESLAIIHEAGGQW